VRPFGFRACVLVRVVVVLAAPIGCAASAGTADGGGGGGETDGGCGGRSPFPPCHAGAAGGVCDTASQARICRGGAWVCPSGAIPGARCGCFGAAASGCTCVADAVECVASAPVGDAGSSGCSTPAPVFCSQGSVGRVCGDLGVAPLCVGGHWQCMTGFIPDPKCGCSIWSAVPDGGLLQPGDVCPDRDPSGGG
jgi:hypothetical protein